ncbi:MAG: hypothetical protein Q9186_006552 [Xanthomendoza sp. 1 TL-2023]
MQPFTILAACFAALAAAAPRADNSDPSPVDPISLARVISVVDKPEKVERCTKLFIDYVEKVKQNEPDVLEYYVNFEHASSKFVTYEEYKDVAALDFHTKTSYLAELLEVVKHEDLEDEPIRVYFLDDVTGFYRKGAD